LCEWVAYLVLLVLGTQLGKLIVARHVAGLRIIIRKTVGVFGLLLLARGPWRASPAALIICVVMAVGEVGGGVWAREREAVMAVH
jgi:hypothetical protein